MYLVKVGNRMYNMDLLIDAQFTPPTSGVDEDSGKEFSHPAKLELRFAAPQSEARTDYNGDYIGEETGLYSLSLRNEEATTAWSALHRTLDNA